MVAVLYFGLDYFSLTGMITVAVGAILIEKFIAEAMVIRKLGLGLQHLPLLKNVCENGDHQRSGGSASHILFMRMLHDYLQQVGEHFAAKCFSTHKIEHSEFCRRQFCVARFGVCFCTGLFACGKFLGRYRGR